jgi:hypothetical protein
VREGWGDGAFAIARRLEVGRKLPLTRKPRNAQLPSSPHKRGEMTAGAVEFRHTFFCGNDGGCRNEGTPDRRAGSFETAAERPPQDEDFL